MKFAARWTTALVAVFSSLPVAYHAGHAAAPIAGWSLEPSNSSCVISRTYGTPQSPTLVGLKAMPEGGGMQLLIARPAYRKEVEQNQAQLTFGKVVVDTTALSYPVGGGGRRSANLINLSADDASRLRKANSFSVTVTSSMHEDLDLGSMADVWPILDACVERLRATWNVGGEETGRVASHATPIVSLRSLFSTEDYPLTAILQKQSGTVKVQLLIDEAGAVKDCTVVQTSGIALLDLRSCAIIMKGAKFKPAVDAKGQTIKSSMTQDLIWLLP